MTDVAVQQTDHFWIPLKDGTRLAARRWQPRASTPLPAIIEYIPYRKGDMTAISDASRFTYLASLGFVCIRIDIRGSGDSDGRLTDEYSQQEMDDGCEAIAWVADQLWCNGNVGLMGISWGGFNALQIAAMRPPALKAIVSNCSTDNRYTDDVHYLGGNVLASEVLTWATSFLGYQSLPPDPDVTGKDWQAVFRARLQQTPHFVETWLDHQFEDDYWAHGSVASDYSAIECPVLLVGGWSDAYTNSIFRLMNGLTAPCKAIVGPWSHAWPDNARPGPNIDYLGECGRWFGQHLANERNEVPSDPAIRYFVQQYTNPETAYKERPGYWATAAATSPDNIEVLHLHQGKLQSEPSTTEDLALPLDTNHGEASGVFCPFGAQGQFPADQQADDERSLVFDSAILGTTKTLFGHANFSGQLATPGGQMVARLCDVAPGGISLLVARAFINLRSSKTFSLTFDLAAHEFAPGHRIRLALATTYWPFLWPHPSTEAAILNTVSASLSLPLVHPNKADESLFAPPKKLAAPAFELIKRPSGSRHLLTDESGMTIESRAYSGHIRLANGRHFQSTSTDRQTLPKNNPDSALVTSERQQQMGGNGWQVSITIESSMTTEADQFVVKTRRNVFMNDELFDTKNWEYRTTRFDFGPLAQ